AYTQRRLLVGETLGPAAVASELGGPGFQGALIESQILPKLDVWDLIGTCALVEPAHLDAQKAGCLVNGQQWHRIATSNRERHHRSAANISALVVVAITIVPDHIQGTFVERATALIAFETLFGYEIELDETSGAVIDPGVQLLPLHG